MTIVLTILHIAVCFVLILVVLAQQGKGQDLASAFGGGGSSAAFGARGAATFMTKFTTGAAILFMLTSLGLSYFRPAISGGSVVPADAPPAETVPTDVGPEQTPPIEGMDPSDQSEEAEGRLPTRVKVRQKARAEGPNLPRKPSRPNRPNNPNRESSAREGHRRLPPKRTAPPSRCDRRAAPARDDSKKPDRAKRRTSLV